MPDNPYRYSCDCCGYKTLIYQGGYDLCFLCDWEDDDTYSWEYPDEVVGGANHDYSLREASRNFHKYYIMYRVANPEQYFSLFKDVIEAKKRLMMYLDIIEALEEHIELPVNSEYTNLKFAILELEGVKEDIPYLINPYTGEIEEKD